MFSLPHSQIPPTAFSLDSTPTAVAMNLICHGPILIMAREHEQSPLSVMCDLFVVTGSGLVVYPAADLDTGGLTTAPIEEFKDMREKLEENKKIVDNFRSRIDSFQAITFTVLGIIVAALAFVGVSKFTDLSWENPSIWQIATWIVMLFAIVTMTVVLAIASIKALWRK